MHKEIIGLKKFDTMMQSFTDKVFAATTGSTASTGRLSTNGQQQDYEPILLGIDAIRLHLSTSLSSSMLFPTDTSIYEIVNNVNNVTTMSILPSP
jgi:hypothetical protein